jgi:hypothetical protein
MNSTDYQPTAWMLETFGADSAGVATALARAATAAQSDGHDAKTGSRLRTNEAYGAATWLAFANHAADELEDLGGEAIRPKRCRYRVGIVGNTLVLATKLAASSKGIDDMRIGSAIRQRILRLAPVQTHTTLDLGDWEPRDAEGHVVKDSEFGAADRAVLVVMEGSVRSGVERICIGDVRIDADGSVLWAHREQLPTTVTEVAAAGLVALEIEQTTDSFAAGDAPEAPLTLVEDEDEDEDTGTDGISDIES